MTTSLSLSDPVAGGSANVAPGLRCCCCGSNSFELTPILWPELVQEWGINDAEAAYIDRQQGLHCADCGSSLRSLALAAAIMRSFGYRGLFKRFVRNPLRRIRTLELNEAGNLHRYLRKLWGHRIGRYPEVDMQRLPYRDNTFDLVVHSDTLEHVPDPVLALSECRRVLRRGGICAFTVPIIVDRMTRSREGLPPSYHGRPTDMKRDFAVVTEYGADAWKHVIAAGFEECRISSLEYPAAQALVGVKALN